MRNDTQRSICVAAGKLDDPSSFHHLFRCLALNALEPEPKPKPASGTKKLLAAYLLTIIGLMVFIKLIKFATKNNNRQHGISPKPVLTERSTMTWCGLYRFSKAEIENVIVSGNGRTCLGGKGRGRGSVSVSQVLKGVLQSGQVVTIKQIDRNESNTSISNSKSLTERVVEVLSMVRHPNLVCLIGFCMEHHGHHCLVYEYCSAGNLAQYLQRKDTVLTWEKRVKILRDCALALNYLHHYMDGCLVHRHIKLSNILLSKNMEAKLSDFVLEMMLRMEMLEKKSVIDCAQVWEDIDLGYMDPEYMVNAKLTCASDIYSFGIVILQLLSGLYVFDDLDLHARDTLRRKALIGGNYGLLNTTTFIRNSDYYGALLWHRLMGKIVLQTTYDSSPYLRVYSHCSKKESGISLLLINMSNSTTYEVSVADDLNFYPDNYDDNQQQIHREEYHLTPKDGNIQSDVLMLNGVPLVLTESKDIPAMYPVLVHASNPISVAPDSIVFATLKDFKAPACS